MALPQRSDSPDSPPVRHCPSPREQDDLELLCHGALAPLHGFESAGGAVTLQVPPEVAATATATGYLVLVDPEGAPLARVDVDTTYPAGDRVGIAGPVTATGSRTCGPFRQLYVSPRDVRHHHGPNTLTVPVTAPLTTHDLTTITESAAGRLVLLLTLVGTGTPEEVSATGLLRASLAAAELLPNARVVAVPLAGHADPIRQRVLRDRVVARYAPGPVQEPPGAGPYPVAIRRIVQHEQPPRTRQGLVVFFTGLSGSGKSTLARGLHDVLLEQGQRTVTSLDGDIVRQHLSAGLGFSRQDRDRNILRIGWVAAEISRHGGAVLCSPIAPFAATRQQVRTMVEDAGGGFVLVHVATPLGECERRDRKGLYARARSGEITDFTGISSPYEEPHDATVRVDTTDVPVSEALDTVVQTLHDEGWLRHEN